MSELPAAALVFTGGLLLGAFFFGGLWWTVRRGLSAQQPALWFFPSLLLRMGAAVTVFFCLGRDDWRRWLLCLLGFLIARSLIRRLTRASEVTHAP